MPIFLFHRGDPEETQSKTRELSFLLCGTLCQTELTKSSVSICVSSLFFESLTSIFVTFAFPLRPCG